MPSNDALNLQAYSYQAMKKGSLSFSFASRLFGRETRDRVVKLYAWCRFVDDQIDDESLSLEVRKWRLDRIAKQSFDNIVDSEVPEAIAAFRELRFDVALSKDSPKELLKGMRMDLDRQQYQSLKELELYCYRVAGVVGLMMSQIMGVKNQRAYHHATELGLAMQLTNISRDVLTDAGMGRIYLPLKWLKQHDIPSNPEEFDDPEIKAKLVPLVEKLLCRADDLYKSGDEGLRYLGLRSALAVAIAREVYSAIGDEVRRLGVRAWDQRAYIPLSKKIFLGFKGVMKALGSRFAY